MSSVVSVTVVFGGCLSGAVVPSVVESGPTVPGGTSSGVVVTSASPVVIFGFGVRLSWADVPHPSLVVRPSIVYDCEFVADGESGG